MSTFVKQHLVSFMLGVTAGVLMHSGHMWASFSVGAVAGAYFARIEA